MTYKLINDNCFDWMKNREENSITAIVTDPPYGVKEYTEEELKKKRNASGGIWRIPPAFDGRKRSPLPRFSVINDSPLERDNVYNFFIDWGRLAFKVLVPGGHIFIASTPLLSDIVSRALRDAGLERRGEIVRVVKTFRGGDRPKGAEKEFSMTTVIPRGCWEPWGLYRKPLSERTVAKNLKRWKAGALHRKSIDTPFCDLIESGKTPQCERNISNHPSLKPQDFMRILVSAALPLQEGIILDPFCGGGSTIAAAEALGFNSIGVEQDKDFYQMAKNAVPKLSQLYPQSEKLLFEEG